MANTDPSDTPDARAQINELRRALEATLQQSQAEISRLRGQLAARGVDGEPAGQAAERLAQTQEIQRLRTALESRERSIETLTEECQRLGDELERCQLGVDRLKQELKEQDSLFNLSREDANRLRQDLEALQNNPARHREAAPAKAGDAVSRWPSLFSMGSSLLLVAALALLAWEHLLPRFWTGAPPPPLPWAAEPSADAAGTDETPAGAPFPPPSIQRDRLRDGSLGPAMVSLPGGLFDMGHSALAGEDFGPSREMAVAPFWLSVYEITFQDYDRFARETDRRMPTDFGWGRGTRPVVDVTWNDARAYAAWLSRATGQRYRLPSESEWEYAARSGGRGSYWWGFGLEPGRAACLDCGSRWDNRSTAPVGTFAPSPFGLHDTAGNVMEWVADCYRPGYADTPADGRPLLTSTCAARVARGGAFNLPAASMRAYVRARFASGTRLNMLGFRLARDP